MLDAPKQCEKNFQDHCYECKQGYYFNEYLNTCESVCGDGIITHDEDCEDNNFIEFDGCNHCKYSCSQQCINCLNGVCQECKRDYFLRDGFCYYEGTTVDFYRYCQLNLNRDCLICVKDYKLNEYGDCVPESSESCIQYYNSQCIQCAQKYELYENQCIQSQQCQVGLYLDQNSFICQSQCGDGYITEWEECDDQNMEHFDGCYQCKYECDDNCIQCVYGECLQCSQEFNLIESKCSSKCQDICINCVQGRCQLCRSGYFLNEYLICIIIDCEYDFSSTPYCGNGIIEDIEQCDDQNLLNDDGCNNYCEKTCDVNCTHCIDDVCFECKEGWKLGSFFCDPICGDFIVVGNEECDDGNYINFDGCFECKYQCSQSCENCLNGICQSCQLNFEFDQLNNSCKPIQTLLTIYEEPNCKLLEGNQCILCQIGYLDAVTKTCIVDYNMNQCNKNCKSCVLSECLECEFGYYGTKCIPKCGDGIIVQEEECDDGIQYQLDDCLNCKYQCPQYCKSCAYGDCIYCFAGFYLDIVSNTCNSVCGDNILASDEVCDDGNELRYDGCFECKYQCQEACLDCQFGKCMLCQLPFIVVHTKGMCEETKSCEDLIGLYYDNDSNDCLPLCGDEIVAGNEDCEDLNSIPDDGCYKCKFECSKNCQICKDRVCIQCQTNYLLNNYQCLLDKSNVSLNSSIIEEPEGNNLDTEIKIETQINSTSTDSTKVEQSSWKENKVCRDDECVYSKKAIMQLTYNKQLYALQYVNINFDQEVKIKDNILKDKQLFNISIADLDTQYYNITINAIQDISFDPSNAQYQVSIEIFQQISTKPILLVQLNKDVVNSNNQTIFNPSESIILQLPQIISGEQKQLSIYAQSSNKAFMIGAIIISAVSLVSGQSSFVIETLNLLQYQSFLRFINIDYPENLQIYFQAQELLSLTSYLNLFEADDYLNLITRKEKQLELSGKFQQYHVEVDLFTNILPQLFQVLALLPLLYFAKNLFLQFLRLSKYMKSLEYQTTIQSKILFAIISLLLNFKNSITQIMKIRYLQNLNKMLQPIYINSWDLIFKVILQLYYNRINNLRSILTTFFAISIFLMCLCLLLKLFSICSNSQNNKIQVIQQVKFIALDISRTMFFHIVLIEFQTEQILQLLLISFSNVSSFYITYQYKLCSKSDRIILLIIEGVLTVFSLSLFLYFEFTQIAISYENKVTLGFIQMYFLIMCLGIVFAKQLYPKVQIVLRQMCKQENVKVASNKLFS